MSAITLDEIIAELQAAERFVEKTGKIELVIYKTNHVLANYEIKATKKKDGKVELHAKN